MYPFEKQMYILAGCLNPTSSDFNKKYARFVSNAGSILSSEYKGQYIDEIKDIVKKVQGAYPSNLDTMETTLEDFNLNTDQLKFDSPKAEDLSEISKEILSTLCHPDTLKN